MRILVLADAGSSHTQGLVRALVNAGVDCKIISFRPAACDVEVISLEPGSDQSDRNHQRLADLAQTVINEWKPDFINSHYVTVYGALALRLSGAPHIASVWGSDILVRPARSIAAAAIVREVLSKAIAIFATSRVLATAARGYSDAPIFVTPFGADNATAQMDRTPIEGAGITHPLIISCAKGLRGYYGLDTAIRVIGLLKTRGRQVRFNIAGDGPLKASLYTLVAELGLEDEVRFLGHLERDAVAQLHAASHIALYPSRNESYGVSLLEALHAGTPVVSTRIGGIPDVLWEETYCATAAVDDVVGLANAVERLAAPKRWKPSSDLARAHASRFEWSKTIKYFTVALRILSESQPKQLANLTGPTIQDVEQAKTHGLYVVHYPFGTRARAVSARPLRVKAMIAALQRAAVVITATGSGRKEHVFALIQLYQRLGVPLLASYAEGHSVPYLSFNRLTDFDWRFYEYRFLRRLAKRAPLIWFIRDAHPLFAFHRKVVGVAEHWKRRILFQLDLAVIGSIATRVAVPSTRFAELLPKSLFAKALTLPPGTDETAGGYRLTDRLAALRNRQLNILYAGGLGPTYNCLPLLAACCLVRSLGYDVRVGLFVRPEEYQRYKEALSLFWLRQAFTTYHVDYERLKTVAKDYNLAAIALRTTTYQAYAYPAKTIDYMAFGLPQVITRGIGAAAFVEREGIGWACGDSVAEIAQTLLGVLQSHDAYTTASLRVHERRAAHTWAIRAQRAVSVDAPFDFPSALGETISLDRSIPAEYDAQFWQYARILQEQVDEASATHFDQKAA